MVFYFNESCWLILWLCSEKGDYIHHHCSIHQKTSVLCKLTLFYRNNWPFFCLQVLCSICEYKGVIKKTKEIPGFMCLCQGRFYGDRCQYGKFTHLFIIILLIFLLLLQTSLYFYYHYYPHYYLTNRLHFSVYVYCNRSRTRLQMSSG